MAAIFTRALRGALFDRKTFDQLIWERSATADGVIVVAVVSLVVFVLRVGFRLSSLVANFLSVVVSDLASWLFLAIATWFVGSRIFKPADDHRRRFDAFQPVLAAHGMAYLPMLLGGLSELGISPGGVDLFATAGFLWYVAAAAFGTAVVMDMKPHEGGISVLLGAAVVFLIRSIF